MAAAAPVRPLSVEHQGNRCPICQDRLMPDWRGNEIQRRMKCCGVLICNPCWKDWDKERQNAYEEFVKVCGKRALEKIQQLHSKKLRARARGEKEKLEDQNKNKTNAKAGKKEEQKKRALEKKLERHLSCPSCRAPIATNAEEQAIQVRRKADQGHAWAQCMLGIFYRNGTGMRKDARQAERWFRAAMVDMSVMDGGPRAAFDLGLMYAEGECVRKDVEEAKQLWTMGHEAGFVKATCALGRLFEGVFGPAAGVPDHEKTMTLYRQAAEAGHDVAQNNLGLCYYKGEGVEQDSEKAKAWYAKAAKQGHAVGMFSLAAVLQRTEGAAAMPTIMTLLRAAAEKDEATAKENLPKLEKDILSSCASCGKPRAAMAEDPKRCNRCFAVAYCSATCQKQHWKRGGHKVACNERRKYLPDEDSDGEGE